jgi:predicted MPP superfamily phosphohydrolase
MRARRLVLPILGLIVALVLAWAFLVEPQRLQVRHVRLALPGLRQPVRIFLLSDVDFPSSDRRENKVVRAATSFRPHVVLVAGDLLDRLDSVRSPATARAAAAWVASLGRPAYLAAGEEESPFTRELARIWSPLGLSIVSNEPRKLRLGDGEIDLFVADRRLDSPPWGLAVDSGRACAMQAGRPVHGFLVSNEPRQWLGTDTTLAFRLAGPESYLDLHVGWVPGDGPSARHGLKVGRFEEEPAFRLTHGVQRTPTGFVARAGVWTRARLRLEPQGDAALFSVRFWEEGEPEPTQWLGRLVVPAPAGGFPGRFAIGGRRGGRAIADLRVTDLSGRLLFEERFPGEHAFRARWSDTSVLERWQRTRDPARPAIVLAHHPDIVIDAIRAGGAFPDLVLAGHTHGGQIRLPFFGPMFTSTSLGRRLDAGLFRVGGVPLYITAGVGTSIVPARFLAPPEVVLLTLEPAEAVARRTP